MGKLLLENNNLLIKFTLFPNNFKFTKSILHYLHFNYATLYNKINNKIIQYYLTLNSIVIFINTDITYYCYLFL